MVARLIYRAAQPCVMERDNLRKHLLLTQKQIFWVCLYSIYQ